MKAVKNILLLDTDPLSAGQIMNSLSIGKDAFDVQHAGGVIEGLNYLQNTAPDLVLLDGNMVEAGNFNAMQTKLAEHNIPCILLSDNGDKNIAGLAEKSGAREYVAKSGITSAHLLKTIVNTLRLSETENRLNLVFEEYSGRISAFSQMLDAFTAGAVVINADGITQYANASAAALMKDAALLPSLAYRPVKGVETIDLPGKNLTLHVSTMEWDNQNCNLFIIEKKEAPVAGNADMSLLHGLLNAMQGHWVLLNNGVVEFANTSFEAMLLKHAGELQGLRIETLLSTPACREIADTGGKSIIGALMQADGSSLAVKYTVGNLNIANNTYQLLGITPSHLTAHTVAGHNNETIAESAPQAGMGGLDGPAVDLAKNIQLMVNCISGGNLEQAMELVQKAETGIEEMGGVLAVFKDYLQLGNETPKLADCPMKNLVEEAMQNMQAQTEIAGAEINISELPTVKADAKLILRVLEQLLDNAFRFSRKDKKPVIDIGHDKYEGNYIFCIRDNGVGISRKDHTRIFEPFEKLDTLHKGNGLGLAICKSIVEKHGGKIWVESLPGHGSNFYFTIG